MLALFTTRYRMPFRLDDVLLMLWAQTHSLADVFDPIKGQLINSFRPIFALTAYLLTRFAGWEHPFWWHLTLDLSLLTGITFTGLTARYLSGRWYALQISVALYFLAFLPILNIFFWYSDLTFGLELAFTSMVWYFGLRGLYEARIGFWLAAMALGVLAVLSKEPALVLVHVVLIGSFLLDRHAIVQRWKGRTPVQNRLAIAGYAVLLAISIWITLVSPTRSNRFFSLSSADAGYFVHARIEYYSAIYLSVIARGLLFMPVLYVLLRGYFRGEMGIPTAFRFSFLTVLAFVMALSLFQNVLIALGILVFILVLLFVRNGPEKDRVLRLLPFLACVVLAFGALFFTIQLVKTQLTEAALLTVILSSWAWCVWSEDLASVLAPLKKLPLFRWSAIVVGVFIGAILVMGTWPRATREERLLREVRNVRQDANNAVQWIALHLPPNSLLAVTQYSLYGFEGPGALTPLPDETKLADQYTFDGGFVFDALSVLGRHDFQRTYLADSVLLPRVLDAMRSQPGSYILLQSKLDLDRFHGLDGRPPLLTRDDTMTAHFTRGPYPCEIWNVRR